MAAKKTNTKKTTKTTHTTKAAAPAKAAPAKAAPAKAAPKKAAAPKAATPTPFTTKSSKAAYEHFLPLAEAVPTENLDVCRADLEVVRVNVERGVGAIRKELAVVQQKLPGCPVAEVLELPALTLAALFAAGKMAKPASNGEIEQRQASMRPMREAALMQLEVFALLKMIPPEVAKAIRQGSGALDNARDATVIPGVFHDYRTAIDGKHPFTPAMLEKLGSDGDWLLHELKPARAKGEPATRDPASVQRDQLWKIIGDRHEILRQAGAVVFGVKNLDDHVPPLQARVASTSTTASTSAATPAATGNGAAAGAQGSTAATATAATTANATPAKPPAGAT